MGLVFAKESDGSADSSCFLRFGLKWKNVADTRNGDKSGKEKGEWMDDEFVVLLSN